MPALLISMRAAVRPKMCITKYCILTVFALIVDSSALNCKSDGGPKDEELRTIYSNCLKKQDNKNYTNHRGYDDDWKETRGHKQNNQWDRDRQTGNRDDRMGGRDDQMGRRSDRRDGVDRMDDRFSNRDDRMGRRDSNMDDRMGRRDSNMDGMDDRMGRRDDKMDEMDDRTGNRDDRMNRNGGYGRVTGRDDFGQSNEFGSDMSRYSQYGYQSTQPPRRFRREKRTGMNSGQRSQYNPNMSSTQRSSGYDDHRNDDRNSEKNSSKKEDDKACALHCFLENLEMTGDNGMPDRYLVTHAITKDVKNEDLRDFLQESIEECFQILDNENTEDKCEFSKNLMLCLSEKGRANCDDWKDEIQF